MKKLLIILTLSILTKFVNGQVNEAVDTRAKNIVNTEVPPLVKVEVNKVLGEVVFDTIYIKQITRGGNIDTLTTPGIYQLSVTGAASAVRLIYVSRNNAGVYSVRTSNPMAWSGTGTWSTSVINGRVVVSTTATNIVYQRMKLQ